MPGKDGGKAKPLKKPKANKDYDEDDKEFLKKKKARRRGCFEKGPRSSSQGKEEVGMSMTESTTQPANPKDCLSCRITGTVVCLGLSAYVGIHTYARPPASPMQRIFMLAASGGFAALGIARAVV